MPSILPATSRAASRLMSRQRDLGPRPRERRGSFSAEAGASSGHDSSVSSRIHVSFRLLASLRPMFA